MLGIALFLVVLTLLVMGLLFMIAWDACEYDRRISVLEERAKEQAREIADLRRKLDEAACREEVSP